MECKFTARNTSALGLIALGLTALGLSTRSLSTMGAILVLLSLTFFSSSVAIAKEPVSKSRLGGVAIGGRDTVAYHALSRDPQDKAIKGKKSHVVKWKGAKWYFGTRTSFEKFKADPEKYSPAYNGFCANALSLGKGLLRTDGTHWEIFGDQLYLFYAAGGRDRWLDAADISEYVRIADEEWSKLSQ